MLKNNRDVVSTLSNAQLAWEFLRRNSGYVNAYRNFEARCLGRREMTRKEEGSILAALDSLGAWRPRYEPWIRAGLRTGKNFIKYVDVDEDYFQGFYFESETNLDPMQFLLREWINPETSPLPIDRQIFDRAGALDFKILRKGTPEFAAAFRLGLVDAADDGTLFEETPEPVGFAGAMVESLLSPNHEVARSVMTLHGFPLRPLLWETLSHQIDEFPRETVVALLRTKRQILSEARTPIVDTHNVLRVHSDGEVQSFDLHVNLQFNLTLPLRDQVEAALVHLEQEQLRLMQVTDKSFEPAHADIHVPNVNGVYKTYLDLLDAYDHAREGHGRLQEAIRAVSGEADLKPGEPRYTTLAKAFARATAIRRAEYRSLAFV